MVHLGHALTKEKHKLYSLDNFQLCNLNRAIKEKRHMVSYNNQNLDSLTVISRPLHFSTFSTEAALNLWKQKKI